ncbi:MAG: hypothetical protein LBD20_00060 [Spirochaetaceae bacterium]|nr:hypothetical protein [Spirochaetaceae bacterium]
MKKKQLTVCALLWCFVFISCEEIADTPAVAPVLDNSFGGWLWENAANTIEKRALEVSYEVVTHFQYRPSRGTVKEDYTVTRWLSENNPDLKQEEGANPISQSYPAGYAIACKVPYGFLGEVIEAVKLQFYLHTDRQSLIIYNNGDDTYYDRAAYPYFIYKKTDISLKDDSVPKRITITGFPADSFIGGYRAARLELIHDFYGRVAHVETLQQGLSNPLVLHLKKPDTNEDWTRGGTFRVELFIYADSYEEHQLGFMGGHFSRWNVSITSADTEIPFFPKDDWAIWGVDE